MKTSETFMEYFRRNYPPNTIITNPDWHAVRIYPVALSASAYGALLQVCQRIQRELAENKELSIGAEEDLRAALEKAKAQS